ATNPTLTRLRLDAQVRFWRGSSAARGDGALEPAAPVAAVDVERVRLDPVDLGVERNRGGRRQRRVDGRRDHALEDAGRGQVRPDADPEPSHGRALRIA